MTRRTVALTVTILGIGYLIAELWRIPEDPPVRPKPASSEDLFFFGILLTLVTFVGSIAGLAYLGKVLRIPDHGLETLAFVLSVGIVVFVLTSVVALWTLSWLVETE